jgi:hypothetical protein
MNIARENIFKRHLDRKLNDAFQREDDRRRDLETALTERFGEHTPELKCALRLIGNGDTGPDQTIDRIPETEEAYRDHSAAFYQALLDKNLEQLVRLLAPFEFSTPLLCQFNETYKAYKRSLLTDTASQAEKPVAGLQADIEEHLKGEEDSLALARFMMGGGPISVVSPKVAERLFQVALEQTVEIDDQGTRARVPHECIREGSEYRAHILAQAFQELGYRVLKIFAHSLTDEHDMLYGGFVDPSELGTDRKSYGYGACCIPVRTATGIIELWIMDPTCNREHPSQLGPWMEWVGRRPGSYQFIMLEDWRKKVEEAREKNHPEAPEDDWVPTDQTYVFTTNCNHINPCPPDVLEEPEYREVPNYYSNKRYNEDGKYEMMKATKWVPYYRIKAAIHQELLAPTIHDDQNALDFLDELTERFRASIDDFHLVGGFGSAQFGCLFSEPYRNFITHLERGNVSAAVITQFKEYLSSDYGKIFDEPAVLFLPLIAALDTDFSGPPLPPPPTAEEIEQIRKDFFLSLPPTS